MPEISRFFGIVIRMFVETGRVAAVGVACTWRPGAGASERAREVLAAAGI